MKKLVLCMLACLAFMLSACGGGGGGGSQEPNTIDVTPSYNGNTTTSDNDTAVVDNGSVTLDWTGTVVNDTTGTAIDVLDNTGNLLFTVLRSEDNGSTYYEIAADTPDNGSVISCDSVTCTYTDSTVTQGTTYLYQVMARLTDTTGDLLGDAQGLTKDVLAGLAAQYNSDNKTIGLELPVLQDVTSMLVKVGSGEASNANSTVIPLSSLTSGGDLSLIQDLTNNTMSGNLVGTLTGTVGGLLEDIGTILSNLLGGSLGSGENIITYQLLDEAGNALETLELPIPVASDPDSDSMTLSTGYQFNNNTGAAVLNWTGTLIDETANAVLTLSPDASNVSFEIQRSSDNGSTFDNITTVTGALNYIDDTIQRGTKYAYQVVANLNNGNGTVSSQPTASTLYGLSDVYNSTSQVVNLAVPYIKGATQLVLQAMNGDSGEKTATTPISLSELGFTGGVSNLVHNLEQNTLTGDIISGVGNLLEGIGNLLEGLLGNLLGFLGNSGTTEQSMIYKLVNSSGTVLDSMTVPIDL